MATTASAIRTAMLALVEGMTPAIESGTPFRRYREQAAGFREWAEANPQAALRRFSIRYLGDFAPSTVNNIVVSETSDTFEVVIAYQASQRFGGAHDLDDVIASDQRQVHARIGPPGYASLTAPATVLHEENWSREESGPVVFAVVRYRVDFYAATGAIDETCSVYTTGGALLRTGAQVTGESDLRALAMENGLVRYTYERPTVGATPAEPAAGHMYLRHDGAWLRCFDQYYGDWSFFAAPIEVTCNYADIVESTDDAVEIAFTWTSHPIAGAYLGAGVLWRDNLNAPFYEDWDGISARFRYITTTKLTKLVRIQRGEAGVYVGWHSDPHIGPPPNRLYVGSPDNNEQAWVEREIGTGRTTAVGFASSGQTAYFPAWALQRAATWAAAELSYGAAITERHWWTGIDDPNYGVMATAGFKTTQFPGFPLEQSTGPWWTAGIPGSDVGVGDVCVYTAQFRPIESGGWQFMPTPGRASLVQHTCNNWMGPAGLVYRFQIFNGATHYVADATSVAVAGYDATVEYGNEPKAGLRATIATLAAGLDWPLT